MSFLPPLVNNQQKRDPRINALSKKCQVQALSPKVILEDFSGLIHRRYRYSKVVSHLSMEKSPPSLQLTQMASLKKVNSKSISPSPSPVDYTEMPNCERNPYSYDYYGTGRMADCPTAPALDGPYS